MAKPALHLHALWIYGVIVGLAIKEALTSVLPDLLLFFQTPPASLFDSASEAWKFFVFLILIIRFYLGAAVYFSEYHDKGERLGTEYVTDFLTGLLHFIFFFALALSLDLAPASSEQEPLLTAFEILLGIILLYDLLWWSMCRGGDRADQVKYWAFVNSGTFILALLVHLVAAAFFDAGLMLAEGLALVPVFAVSIIDILEIAKNRHLIGEFLDNINPKKK